MVDLVYYYYCFSYITFTEKLKNTDSNISEYNLNSVSGGLLDEKS